LLDEVENRTAKPDLIPYGRKWPPVERRPSKSILASWTVQLFEGEQSAVASF